MNGLISFFYQQLLMSIIKNKDLKCARKLKFKNEVYIIMERIIKHTNKLTKKQTNKEDKDMLTQK